MNVLVVAPHPDDETLRAGGTLLKYIDSGNKIYYLRYYKCKRGIRISG